MFFMDKLHTVKETCEILKISRGKLYLLIKDNSLTPVKIGKKTLFKESELQRFIESLNDGK
jgi:excisionase family DNA binding protein